MVKLIISAVFFFFFNIALFGQNRVLEPNFAVSTHPLAILAVEKTHDSLIVEMSIENQSSTGYFCVNKKTYIESLPEKNKIFALSITGIPVCPNVYHFKWVGEKKYFKLIFPAPDTSVKYVNIIEGCSDHCFSIYGLILNPKLNDYLNRGYDYYNHNNLQSALETFEKALRDFPDYPFAVLPAHIIKILLEQKKYSLADRWYKQLLNSHFLDKNAIIKQVENYSGYDKMLKE